MKSRGRPSLVDESYHEFFRITCRQCGRQFRPTGSTYHYCREACAYRALLAREQRPARLHEEEDGQR